MNLTHRLLRVPNIGSMLQQVCVNQTPVLTNTTYSKKFAITRVRRLRCSTVNTVYNEFGFNELLVIKKFFSYLTKCIAYYG